MKNSLRKYIPLLFAYIFSSYIAFSQYYEYPDPGKLNTSLKELHNSHSSITKIHKMANSPGNNEVLMIEIGEETSSEKKAIPAILVVGNLEGTRPIASLGAYRLAEKIIKEEHYRKNTWYIIPAGNPDAHYAYFSAPVYERQRNGLMNNDDLDHLKDEDNFNDLNNDGIITSMRVKHPEGEWLIVNDDPRLMRKADPKKGEQGIYKIYTEGIDDDKDGKYNEDLPGGTNVNRNFPHLFQTSLPESGLYPGSSPEARSIIEFAFEHPEIAMTFSFGATNFCYTPPKGGRKGEVDMNNIKIPERMAGMIGADPDKSYSMQEIIEMVQPLVPAGMTVDESMVASFLGLGAVVNPLDADLVFYKKFTDDYQKYLEEKAGKKERFDPEKARDGSFELWSYYHLGVPVFSMDLWSISKPEKEKKEEDGLTVDKLEKMSPEDFLALGEEKIEAFLKKSGVPDQFTAKGVISMVESGRLNPERIASMIKQMPAKDLEEGGADPKEKALLDYSDKVLNGEGFVEWEKVNHLQLGEVEIGGFVPFLQTTPELSVADSVIDLKIPWIFEIVKELPSLSIYETKVNLKGAGVYELELWIENTSYIPFPTAMGERNKQPAPAIITLSGDDFTLLSGLSRTPVNAVKGKSRKKLSWLIQADKRTDLIIDLTSKSAGDDKQTVKIGG